MNTFKQNYINKIVELKELLNYTFSSFESNVLDSHKMFFVYFNDFENRIELHSDRSLEFKQKGILNEESLLFSIDYEKVINTKLILQYDKDGKIEKIRFGCMNYYSFWGLHKQTSHSVAGEYKGLFTVETGFESYNNYLNSDE